MVGTRLGGSCVIQRRVLALNPQLGSLVKADEGVGTDQYTFNQLML